MSELLNYSIQVSREGMLYQEETSKEFIYYIGLPGLEKQDLDITVLIETNVATILVVTKKDSIFVNKDHKIRIVKFLDDIKYDNNIKNIKAEMHDGILEIIINKSTPTQAYKI